MPTDTTFLIIDLVIIATIGVMITLLWRIERNTRRPK
jgi:hypothetical protein